MSRKVEILIPNSEDELVLAFEAFKTGLEYCREAARKIDESLSALIKYSYSLNTNDLKRIHLSDGTVFWIHRSKNGAQLWNNEFKKSYASIKAFVILRDAELLSKIYSKLKDPQEYHHLLEQIQK